MTECKFVFNRIKTKNMPLLVTIEVTRACNLSCRYCGIYKTAKWFRNMSPTKEFFIDVSKRINELDMNAEIFFTGGEPLTRIDFVNMLEEINRTTDIKLAFATNGTLITQKIAEKIMSVEPSLILVSLDTLDRKKYIYLRGKDLLNNAVDGLKILTALKKELGLKTRIVVNTVLTKLNIDEYKDLLFFLDDIHVDRFQFSPVILDKRNPSRADLELDTNYVKKLEEIIRFIKNKKFNNIIPNMPEAFITQSINYVLGKDIKSKICHTGYNFFHINIVKKIFPCCVFYQHRPEFRLPSTMLFTKSYLEVIESLKNIVCKADFYCCKRCMFLLNYTDGVKRTYE